MKVIIINTQEKKNPCKASSVEKLYQQLKKQGYDVLEIEQANFILDNNIQNTEESLFEKPNFESKSLAGLPSVLNPLNLSHSEKSKGLAKLLLQHTIPLDRVVQSLSKMGKDYPRPRKIGQVSLELCLLNQTSTLLWLLSEHVIPHLEQ